MKLSKSQKRHLVDNLVAPSASSNTRSGFLKSSDVNPNKVSALNASKLEALAEKPVEKVTQNDALSEEKKSLTRLQKLLLLEEEAKKRRSELRNVEDLLRLCDSLFYGISPATRNGYCRLVNSRIHLPWTPRFPYLKSPLSVESGPGVSGEDKKQRLSSQASSMVQ